MICLTLNMNYIFDKVHSHCDSVSFFFFPTPDLTMLCLSFLSPCHSCQTLSFTTVDVFWTSFFVVVIVDDFCFYYYYSHFLLLLLICLIDCWLFTHSFVCLISCLICFENCIFGNAKKKNYLFTINLEVKSKIFKHCLFLKLQASWVISVD